MDFIGVRLDGQGIPILLDIDDLTYFLFPFTEHLTQLAVLGQPKLIVVD